MSTTRQLRQPSGSPCDTEDVHPRNKLALGTPAVLLGRRQRSFWVLTAFALSPSTGILGRHSLVESFTPHYQQVECRLSSHTPNPSGKTPPLNTGCWEAHKACPESRAQADSTTWLGFVGRSAGGDWPAWCQMRPQPSSSQGSPAETWAAGTAEPRLHPPSPAERSSPAY